MILPGILTPVASDASERPDGGPISCTYQASFVRTMSTTATPPPMASTAETARAFNSSVTGSFSIRPPSAMVPIQ